MQLMLPSHIPFRESSIDPSPVPGRKTKKRPEIWIVDMDSPIRISGLASCRLATLHRVDWYVNFR
ncbi:hypothetical protein BIFBIF_00773 [Bifidobacterium bifidum ATCC 29521 = JCM 1255 = DSM 20456]|nr:hypothetical protein BIFBIF_00773 [Bifidobacterium bifidum ATCC 29521 = JCM 1255 = DSM 20456]